MSSEEDNKFVPQLPSDDPQNREEDSAMFVIGHLAEAARKKRVAAIENDQSAILEHATQILNLDKGPESEAEQSKRTENSLITSLEGIEITNKEAAYKLVGLMDWINSLPVEYKKGCFYIIFFTKQLMFAIDQLADVIDALDKGSSSFDASAPVLWWDELQIFLKTIHKYEVSMQDAIGDEQSPHFKKLRSLVGVLKKAKIKTKYLSQKYDREQFVQFIDKYSIEDYLEKIETGFNLNDTQLAKIARAKLIISELKQSEESEISVEELDNLINSLCISKQLELSPPRGIESAIQEPISCAADMKSLIKLLPHPISKNLRLAIRILKTNVAQLSASSEQLKKQSGFIVRRLNEGVMAKFPKGLPEEQNKFLKSIVTKMLKIIQYLKLIKPRNSRTAKNQNDFTYSEFIYPLYLGIVHELKELKAELCSLDVIYKKPETEDSDSTDEFDAWDAFGEPQDITEVPDELYRDAEEALEVKFGFKGVNDSQDNPTYKTALRLSGMLNQLIEDVEKDLEEARGNTRELGPEINKCNTYIAQTMHSAIHEILANYNDGLMLSDIFPEVEATIDENKNDRAQARDFVETMSAILEDEQFNEEMARSVKSIGKLEAKLDLPVDDPVKAAEALQDFKDLLEGVYVDADSARIKLVNLLYLIEQFGDLEARLRKDDFEIWDGIREQIKSFIAKASPTAKQYEDIRVAVVDFQRNFGIVPSMMNLRSYLKSHHDKPKMYTALEAFRTARTLIEQNELHDAVIEKAVSLLTLAKIKIQDCLDTDRQNIQSLLDNIAVLETRLRAGFDPETVEVSQELLISQLQELERIIEFRASN